MLEPALLLEYGWVLVVLVVLEGLLAADNALVLAIMVKHLPEDIAAILKIWMALLLKRHFLAKMQPLRGWRRWDLAYISALTRLSLLLN